MYKSKIYRTGCVKNKYSATHSAKILSGILFASMASFSVDAAVCDWAGGTGNWTDSNWNNCLGGIPGSVDTASITTGSVSLDQIINIQSFILSGATLSGTGTLNITGQTQLTGSSSVMNGTGTTRAEGGLIIDSSLLTIQSSRSLINAAGQNADWRAGGIRLLSTGSTLRNEATATFNFTGATRSLTGGGLFDNQGSLLVNLNDSTQEIAVTSALNNSGNIDVQTGVLRLAGNGTHSGTFTGNAGTILEFSGGTQTLDATSAVTANSVRFSNQDRGGASVSINGLYDVANTRIEGNIANFNSSAQTGTLTQVGGVLSGTGTLNITGQTQITTGSSVMNGTGTTRAEGGLIIDGSFLDIQNSRSLINAAGQNADWRAGGIRLLSTGSTLRNEATATFNFTGATRSLTGGGLFDNQGSLLVNLDNSTRELIVTSALNNSGNIDVQNGTLRLGGNGAHSGTFTGNAGAILEFSGGTQTLDANSAITANDVSFSNQERGGASVSINGRYDVANTFIFGNIALFNSDSQTDTLTQTGGTLSGTGTLNVTGQTRITGNNSLMNGTGTTRAEGGLIIDGNLLNIQGSRSLVNAAGQNATWRAGSIRLSTNTATPALINEDTATFNITGAGLALTGTSLFDNQGSLLVKLNNNEEVNITSALNNNGNIDVQTGTLRLRGNGTHSGAFTASAGAILEFGGGIQTLDANSTVTANDVRFKGSRFTSNILINGLYNVVNTNIENGRASFNTNSQTNTLTQTGGILDGTGTLNITGQTQITGGSSFMSGTGTTRAKGGLIIDGNFLDIQSNRSLINTAGQNADWRAGSIRLLNTGSTLRNEASATFNVTGTSRALIGAGLFDNQGSLLVNFNDSTQILSARSRLVNNGQLSVQQGTLALFNDASGTGQWQANGGKIQLNTNTDVNTSGNIEISNAGELELNNNASFTANSLAITENGTLTVLDNSLLSLSGNLSFAQTNEAQWSFADAAILEITGGVGATIGDWGLWSSLEIGGSDSGIDPVNHIGDVQGFTNNFDLAELRIGAGGSVYLGDLFDNGNRNGTFGSAEALYVDTLVFADASALLNLNGLNIYYNNLIGDTSQIINETVVPVPAAVWLFVSGILALSGIARRKA